MDRSLRIQSGWRVSGLTRPPERWAAMDKKASVNRRSRSAQMAALVRIGREGGIVQLVDDIADGSDVVVRGAQALPVGGCLDDAGKRLGRRAQPRVVNPDRPVVSFLVIGWDQLNAANGFAAAEKSLSGHLRPKLLFDPCPDLTIKIRVLPRPVAHNETAGSYRAGRSCRGEGP
jgi:hypothetical protein